MGIDSKMEKRMYEDAECSECGEPNMGPRGCNYPGCPYTDQIDKPKSEANKKQHGGNHYKSEFEHWDMVRELDLDYLAGCATKYLSRWRKKNGVEDLRKARHYTQKLAETDNRPIPQVTSRDAVTIAQRFCITNGLMGLEFPAVMSLCTWRQLADLEMAIAFIDAMIRELSPPPKTPTVLDKPPGYANSGKIEHPAPFGYDPKEDDESASNAAPTVDT